MGLQERSEAFGGIDGKTVVLGHEKVGVRLKRPAGVGEDFHERRESMRAGSSEVEIA